MNACDDLVRGRTALKGREKNLLLPLLKRQAKARLDQIARHIEAIDKQTQALITACLALLAARFNSDIEAKYSHLISIEMPVKIAITAVMRKLIVMANALFKANRLWTESMA